MNQATRPGLPGQPPQQSLDRPQLAAALLLLAVGALLRFYDLGVHSQWFDEMLVTVHSSYPASYILDLCWRVEIHPPAFYFLVKALQAACPSDFFIRLPSALAGTTSLALIGLIGARLARNLGQDARLVGLAAMALACVNPMHIWISRQVRPYAIMQVFCCLALLALLRLLENPGRGSLVRLALANAPIVWLHYLGLLLVAGQGLCLLMVRAVRPGLVRLKDVLSFAGLSAALALPVLPFLVSAKWLHKSPFLTTTGDMAEAKSKISSSILEFLNFGYFDGAILWVLPVGATALGLAMLWRADRERGVACLTLLASFPLMLLAAGYSGHFTPVHMSYHLPIIFACQAVAFRGLLPEGMRTSWAPLALAAVLGALFLNHEGRAFYHPDKQVADAWHHQERYKTVARFLAANAGPDSFAVVDNAFAAQAVDWYMGALSPARSLADFRVRPGQDFVQLLYLSKERDPLRSMASPAFIRRVLTPPALQGEIGRMDLYMLHVPHTGFLEWSPDSRLAGGAFAPDTFLRSVRSLENIRVFAEHQFWLCPARTGAEGEAVFRFASPQAFPAGAVYMVLDAQVRRPGNRLEVEASFDGGESLSVLRLDRPYHQGPIWIRAESRHPFRTMDVRLRMHVSGQRAYLPDGPLEQLRVSGLSAFVPTASNRFHSPGLEVSETGLESPEPDGKGGLFRWGLERTRLEFAMERPGPAALLYTAESPLPGQRGRVTVNGLPAGMIDLSGGRASGRLEFDVVVGPNTVEIAWDKRNAGPDAFAPEDHRPLAAMWSLLCVEPAAPVAP